MNEFQFFVDDSKCIKCGACIRDCALEMLEFDPERELPHVIPGTEDSCTRCQHCLTICPTGALEIFGRDPEESLPPDSNPDPEEILSGVNGVIVPGGFGTRGTEGMIAAARYARENGVPFLGVCLGFQIATIEICRDVLGLKDATSTEFDPDTPDPVICIMGEQKGVTDMGATMRLGAQTVSISEGSKAFGLYDEGTVSERHRHRYEVNPGYIDRLESAGWHFTGRSECGTRMEIGELDGHPFFMAAQFHPEFRSRPGRPSPLHQGLVDAAIAHSR